MGKTGDIIRKAALLTAGAVLFGTVSGSVMVGINVAVVRLLGEGETVSPPAPEIPEILPPQEPGETAPLPPQEESAPGAQERIPVIAEQAMPSVVAVTSTVVYQDRFYGGYGWFFGGGGSYEVPSSGSGIIVGINEEELLVATNFHVVEEASSLKVAFIDGQTVDARVKGSDSANDLAVLSIRLESIPEETRPQIRVADLGSSEELRVGQGVIAIGNALGYGQSVTVGYISALNREVRVSETETQILLQTDAAINPGNSGGALLNMEGEVIGINSAKYSSTEVEGIGYAIPISSIQEILNELMNRQIRETVPEAERGYLGIQGTTVDAERSRAFGMPEGVYVYQILENSGAAQSELWERDIITRLDGAPVHTMENLQRLLTGYRAGEQVELSVQRQEDGSYREVQVIVTLGSLPEGEE